MSVPSAIPSKNLVLIGRLEVYRHVRLRVAGWDRNIRLHCLIPGGTIAAPLHYQPTHTVGMLWPAKGAISISYL